MARPREDKGLTVMVDLTKLDAPYLNTVLVASRRYLKENPQQTEAFLKGTIDGLYFLTNPANERAVKSVLARRLKLSTPQAIQIMYDATVEIHAKTKVPYATHGRRAKHDRRAQPRESTPGQTQGGRYDRQFFHRTAR